MRKTALILALVLTLLCAAVPAQAQPYAQEMAVMTARTHLQRTLPTVILLGIADHYNLPTELISALQVFFLSPFVVRPAHPAAAIGIIGGADGPTAIYVAGPEINIPPYGGQ